MKKFILLTVVSIFLFGMSVQAQTPEYYSRSLDNYARDLKRYSVDLVDTTERELKRGRRNNRNEIQNAFRARQLDASAGLLQQMISGNRPAEELRDAASIVSELLRGAPTYGTTGNLWRSASASLDDLNRELGSTGRFGGGDGGVFGGDSDGFGGGSGNRNGSVVWNGSVDNKIQLTIRGDRLTSYTIAGRTYPSNNFRFTSPLPRRDVTIRVDKKDGRGDVRIYQQPSRANNYTAILEIEDKDGGADNYRLEVYWD